MRLLLLIPALLLFLANVSFVKKIPAAEMMGKAKKEGCCKKEKATHMSGCGNTSEDLQEDNSDETGKQCQKESTCFCVCVFQFTAPAQSLPEFNFTSQSNTVMHSSMHEYYWKNPYIVVPWQPPDFI